MKQNIVFRIMLVTLGGLLLGILLTGKSLYDGDEVIWNGQGITVTSQGQWKTRAGQNV